VLVAHMRWSADAFGLHALSAWRGLDAGLDGDGGRRLCVLGPLRTLLQTPGRARRRTWGESFTLHAHSLLPSPLSSMPTLRRRCLGLLSPWARCIRMGLFCVVCFAFVACTPSRDEDVHAYARVAVECRERRYTATTRRACGQSISTRIVNTRARARKRACICAACAHVRMHMLA
jgi:hypothetical protein